MLRNPQLVLAIAPRNLFDHHHATMAALDAPHAVQEKNQDSQKGMNSKRRSGR
jgi:hypothetical protein